MAGRDPFATGSGVASGAPLLWSLQDVLSQSADGALGRPAQGADHTNEEFVKSQEQQMADQVGTRAHVLLRRSGACCGTPTAAATCAPIRRAHKAPHAHNAPHAWPRPQVSAQRRRLPDVLNDRALFTRAVPFGDRGDPAYHSPSSRIGGNYSPAASGAASALLVQPQVGTGEAQWARPAAVATDVLRQHIALKRMHHPSLTLQEPHQVRSKGPLGAGTSGARPGAASPPPAPGALAHPSMQHHLLPPLRQAAGAAGGPLGLSLVGGARGASPIPAVAATSSQPYSSPAAVGNPLRATSPGPLAGTLLERPPRAPRSPSPQRGLAAAAAEGAAAAGGARSDGGAGAGEHGSIIEAEVADAIMRYHYYVERGIDARHIAPYRCVAGKVAVGDHQCDTCTAAVAEAPGVCDCWLGQKHATRC